MRNRPSPASRASNGALRAVDADGDTTSIEPFDDVSEPGTHNHADHARGLNGTHGVQRSGGANSSGHESGRSNASNGDTQHEPLSPDDPLAPLPFNPYKGNRGLTRAWHAMKNSLAGFRVAIREESAFRQELTLAAILIPCGVLVPVEPVSRVLLLGSVLLVLIVELLNSSVEAAIDRISLERHELSRRAKDLGSAAVMVALGMCLMTWVLIVGPLVVHWVKAWL
ncbi:diacylglycerol kinase [Paraburkholderia sp. BCC1884]|uniref:diacylglycerol kinase n=1 Tax=Paraburkholderia sp. BCC1884 TaxID=2562668 RepID=UPI0011821E0F|nr:diacylglycerol kinase [Paraburkholderia sp. BCC1884]